MEAFTKTFLSSGLVFSCANKWQSSHLHGAALVTSERKSSSNVSLEVSA